MKLQYIINFTLIVFIIFLVVGHFKTLEKFAEYQESIVTKNLVTGHVDILNAQGKGIGKISSDAKGNGSILLFSNSQEKNLLLMATPTGSFVISDVHATLDDDGKVNPIHESAIKELNPGANKKAEKEEGSGAN